MEPLEIRDEHNDVVLYTSSDKFCLSIGVSNGKEGAVITLTPDQVEELLSHLEDWVEQDDVDC